MMNMLKKIIALCVILMFVLSTSFCLNISASRADDVTDAQNSFEFLKATGIVADEVFQPEKIISRAEFVRYAVSAMNMHPSNNGYSAFADVDAKSEYAPYINAAYNIGIISGNGASAFEPDSPVSLSAAVKILCGILGYGELAELNGGYEVGYYTYANSYGILDGVSASSNASALTMSQVVLMLDNAVKADVLEAVGYSEGFELKNRENNLLSLYFNIYEATGIVSANAFTTLLTANSELEESQVEIGSVVFESNNSGIENYPGYEFDFYYRNTPSMSKPEIVWYELSENCIATKVNADDIAVTGSEVEYENDDGSVEEIKVDSVAVYILNGKMASMKLTDITNVNGNVTFVSNDGDKVADVIIVEDYVAMIVKGVSGSSPVGISVNGDIMSLEEDDDVVITIEKNGIPVSVSDIAKDNVLLIAQSEGDGLCRKHIIVSDNAVSGRIDMTDDDAIYVNGVEYKTDKSVFTNLRAGVTYKFLVDAFGYIRYAEKINDVVYGYLTGIKNFGMEGSKCRIFTENGRWVELELANKIRLNGTIKEKEAVVSYFGTNPEEYRQLVRYTVNENAEVNMIETALSVDVNSDAEKTAVAEDTFRIVYNGKSTWRNTITAFEGKYRVDDSTLIFTLPDDMSEDGFSIKDKSIFAQDTSYEIEIYDTDSLLRPKVMVVNDYEDEISVTSTFMIVDSIRSIVNRDGVSTLGIHGFWSGAKITIPVKIGDKITESQVRSLKTGNVIQFSVNDNSEIIDYHLHLPDENGYYIVSRDAAGKTSSDYYKLNTVVSAKVQASDAVNNIIRIEYQPDTIGIATLNSSTKCYLYDSKEQTYRIADKAEILEGDTVIAKMRYLVCNEIIIVR